MEIVIAIFLGTFLIILGILSYKRVSKDYEEAQKK